MRFFTPILAISAAALSNALTVADPCQPNGCLTIASLQFYAPTVPNPDELISINFDVESADKAEKCTDDWKYGKDGKEGYPSATSGAIVCNAGNFAFYFDSFSSISKFEIEVKYTYTVGSVTKTALAKVSVTKSDLYCSHYLNSKVCQLDSNVHGIGLQVPIYQTI